MAFQDETCHPYCIIEKYGKVTYIYKILNPGPGKDENKTVIYTGECFSNNFVVYLSIRLFRF